jgi:uncharacterized membrane protein YdjX (TVP38/TMEM64 family)
VSDDRIAPPAAAARAFPFAKVAAVLAVVVLLVVALHLGVLQDFADPQRARQTLLGLGPIGFLVFVLAYAALQPFGVPGTAFVVAAALVWPWPTAFALSMVGTMAASVVGFTFARFVARDAIEARIPARFRRYEALLLRRAFATVFLLRLVFWMPPLLHAFFGVSRVRFWTHFWGSALGYVAPLLLVSYVGAPLFDFLKKLPPSAWALVAAKIVVVALVGWWWRRRRAIARAAHAAPASEH